MTLEVRNTIFLENSRHKDLVIGVNMIIDEVTWICLIFIDSSMSRTNILHFDLLEMIEKIRNYTLLRFSSKPGERRKDEKGIISVGIISRFQKKNS